METNLTYTNKGSGTDYTDYFNICKDLATVNSRNYEHTTRDGHVKGYIVSLELQSLNPGNLVTVQTIPNSWKMRNSFRKFHAYRDLMFKNSGITEEEKGRYGKTIRPYMDDTLTVSNQPFVGTITGGDAATGGEWSYSRLATVPLYTEEGPTMGSSTLKVADEWTLHVLDDNTFQTSESGTSGQYSSVGMIHSYNIDRMEVVTPSAEVTVDGPSNPLAALIATGNQATGEILDIAEEQELELPPYDLLDNGDSVKASIAGIRRAGSLFTNLRWTGFVPAGLFSLNLNEGAPIAYKEGIPIPNGNPTFLMNMTVVAEVLCKDMA
ncbi:MAG: hypothetical protein [Circular genetic element sp.]|nr:MAG: hypothetical protein [Circular genetic element sp.]